MSWFGNRNREGKEGKEAENTDAKPRNQILQTPENSNPDAKKKLENGDNKQSFEDRIKVNPNDLNKQQPEKKKLDTSSNSEDPNKGQRTDGREHPKSLNDGEER